VIDFRRMLQTKHEPETKQGKDAQRCKRGIHYYYADRKSRLRSRKANC
jgi:hypothetical protein